jgi:hypothetical protein
MKLKGHWIIIWISIILLLASLGCTRTKIVKYPEVRYIVAGDSTTTALIDSLQKQIMDCEGVLRLVTEGDDTW